MKSPRFICGLRSIAKDRRIATPHHVEILLWDPKAQCIKGKTETAKTVNQQLTIMKADMYRHYSIFLSLGKPITAELLKNAYVGLGEKQKTLCEIFEIHNLRFEEKVNVGIKSPASLKRMKATKNKIKAFMLHNFQLSDKQLSEIKPSFISDFEHFLITAQQICYNTANKYLKILKQVFKMAVEQGLVTSSPFSGFRCKYEETHRERLTMGEIMILYNKDMHCERLNEVRNVYIFCCFTGFAYQDVFDLTPEHMLNGIDGEKWVTKQREKTDSPERVPYYPFLENNRKI